MQFSAIFAAVASLLVAAQASPLAIRQDDPLNGFSVCAGTTPALTISSLSYGPLPLVPGNNVTVTINADSTTPLEAGTTVKITAKYLFITALNQTIDICSSGASCPIPAGPQSFGFTFQIPANAPKGVKVDMKSVTTDAAGKELLCVQNKQFQL
ncbi:hypothetical protein HDV05_000714 [Chytridiales sp. JEL 0842]|nr:hypothetical protein HDV05_000714 [Chytridiales sp. JEL 0842]